MYPYISALCHFRALMCIILFFRSPNDQLVYSTLHCSFSDNKLAMNELQIRCSIVPRSVFPIMSLCYTLLYLCSLVGHTLLFSSAIVTNIYI